MPLLLTWKVDKLNKCISFKILLYVFTQNTEYIVTPYGYGYFNYLYLSIIFYAFSYEFYITWYLYRADILINLYFSVASVEHPKSLVT